MEKKGKAGEIDKVIGRNIRKIRQSLKLSAKDIAELIGVTYQQVQKYERGENRISATNLYILSISTKTPMLKFFNDEGNKK